MSERGLAKLIVEKDTYNAESQAFIESLRFVDKEINILREMKSTAGWKLIDSKIREEVHERIRELVKDDVKIQTLLAILLVAETKKLKKALDDEIDKVIPGE